MLSVQNLTTGYGKKKVLDNVSMSVNEGEFVLLTGGNGSGKSTLLKSIYGLLSPWKNEDETYGQIIYNNKNIANISSSNLLKLGIVYVPQKKNIFEDLTVIENLLVATNTYSKKDSKSKIEYVFENIPELVKLKKRYPFSMSGGEKQLLAFGSILVYSPKLILLDEPFAGIDVVNIEILIRLIISLNQKGVTFIIVEHKKYLFNDYKTREIILELGNIKT